MKAVRSFSSASLLYMEDMHTLPLRCITTSRAPPRYTTVCMHTAASAGRLARNASGPSSQFTMCESLSARSGVAVRPRMKREDTSSMLAQKVRAAVWCASSTMVVPNSL